MLCVCQLQALFVEAKLQASEELGHYIDELNASLEEKRVIFQMAQKSTQPLQHAYGLGWQAAVAAARGVRGHTVHCNGMLCRSRMAYQ